MSAVLPDRPNPAADVADAADDHVLMTRIAGGDRDAFADMLDRHLTGLVQFAARYLPQTGDAQDVAQETFLRLWRSAPRWQTRDAAPKTWLYRIAYNLCVDELRRRKRHAPWDDDAVPPSLQVESAEQTAATDARRAQVEQGLSAIPERQRTAIALCALHGLSNQAAAAVMDISVDALESLLARGRRKLRAYLSELEGQAP